MKRCTERRKIGPHAVDYNSLMRYLEVNKLKILLLTPRYGLFGGLKGYYAYLTKKGSK